MAQFHELVNNLMAATREEVEEFNCDLVSDGYHTFGELYEHRIRLFIVLCLTIVSNPMTNNLRVWKKKDNLYDGWFILGINLKEGEQITYHLPMDKWNDCAWAEEGVDYKYDGHTSDDVLKRLEKIYKLQTDGVTKDGKNEV